MKKSKEYRVIYSSKVPFQVLGSGLIKKRDRGCMRRILLNSVFLFALIILFLSSGSSWAVIYISNITDLQKIGNDAGYPLNGEYELTQDIDASDTVNWNSEAGFNPIGTSSNPFTGKFDGKGYKITGLYINRPLTDYVGLFGYTGSTASIRNTGIENCQITGNNNVGCLEGYAKGSVIVCYSTGTIRGNNSVGGLVGYNDYGAVSNSFSSAYVFAPSDSGNSVGGLVGSNTYYGTVSECYSTGAVSGHDNVGGLVGSNTYYGAVSSCYSTKAVSGHGNVGGLVGENSYGTVSECYSTGTVSGSGDIVGGLVGYNFYGTVSNSYSTGTVEGVTNVGGLIGYFSGGSVSKNYWDMETSGQSSSAGGTGVIGKMTTEMKQQATFSGWDFTNVWGIIENLSYPYLLWQGVPFVSIPDVIGLTQVKAESAITGAGLTVGTVTEQCSDTVPSGNVISQDPIGGEQAPPRTAVNLVVSTGLCPEGEGVVEGTPEGTPEGEGVVEGEGAVEGTPEGTLEGTVEGEEGREGILEGSREGSPEGTVEGTKEGEGMGGGGEPNMICGCSGKSLGEEWWKYLVDFVLVGMVITAMSGMQRRRR